ncbi:MAG: hemolysin family protein [Deltaproteobacteria bacterium]|nr:hemolysin family protein [Deltaproteobacteria bacterium]
MTVIQYIAILILCLLAEGFFTGAEMAVVHTDKLSLRSLARKGSARAKSVLAFLSKPGKFFSTTLLGTNLAVVTASVCTTYFIVENFGENYEGLALLLSPIVLILGEIVPKSLFQHYADRIVLKIIYPLRFFGLLFSPVIWMLSKMTDSLLGGVTKQVGGEVPVTRDELEELLSSGKEASEEPEKVPARRTMISKIFDLAEKRVTNIMIPLVDVEALSDTAAFDSASALFAEKGFSRLPVFHDRIFNMVGVLHNIDLLFADPLKPIRQLMRPAWFVPEGMPLDELLVTMKRKGEPMAIVVDEFGGASGIVTFEDLIEQVIGDIQDEYDYAQPLYYRIGKNRFLVSGRFEITEANEKLQLGIPTGEYETIAGFLIHQMGAIPQKGSSYRFGRLEFIIHRATEKAVQEVEIRLSS